MSEHELRSRIQTLETLVRQLQSGGSDPLKLDAAKVRAVRVAITSLGAMATTTLTCTWPTAFADTNYTWAWSILTTTTSANDLRVLTALSKTAAGVTVLVQNTTAGGPESGVLECIAIHD